MEALEILNRFEKAQGERLRFEAMYDDAIRLTMPGRKRFSGYPSDAGEDIFDETGANAVSEFVSRMYSGLVPPFSKFVQLEASSLVDARDRVAVNRDLDEINDYMFEEIWKSNFSQEAAESFYDMAISTGVLNVEEGSHGRALHHKAIPLTDVYLEAGYDGSIGGLFRCSKMKASEIMVRWPKARLGMKTKSDALHQKERQLDLIEYTRAVPGRIERHEHFVVVKEHKEIIIERVVAGAGSDPFLKFRWGTTAGEVNGRGPLLNALAAIRTTNLMVELVLENAAMSIVGLYQTDNDATVNADQVSLLPGTILSREIGTKGLEAVQAATGNFNMQDVVLGDQRLNIKRALFNDMLSDPNKTPATAYEVAERMADLAYRSSAGYARLSYEFVQPYVSRVLHILEKRGDIKLPVKNGRALSFRAVSPLAQAQGGREVQSLLQQYQITAAIYGPQAAAAQFELERLLPWMQNRTGLEDKLFKDPKAVVKAITDAAAQMAQMQQAAAAPAPQGPGMMV